MSYREALPDTPKLRGTIYGIVIESAIQYDFAVHQGCYASVKVNQ